MEKSTEAVECSEGCEDSAGIDVIPLTEASNIMVDHDGNDENYASTLDSFRKQWKQELQAGTKRISDFDGRTVNKNNCTNPGLRTSDHPSSPPALSPYSHVSSKKQTSYRSSAVTSCSAGRGGEGADQEPSSASSGGGNNHQAPLLTPSPLAARQVAQDRRSRPGGNSLSSNINNNNNTDNAIRLQASDEDLKKDKARALYVRGVELERAGQLYEAIQQYRRAMQLVPDIETIALQQTADSEDESGSDCEDSQSPELGGGSLYSQLTALMSPPVPVCQPLYQQQAVHLSALPREILEQVLCWVVGGDLDIRSLHATAATCRGLYVVTRAETLWKKACIKVWGKGCSLGDNAPSSPSALREGVTYGNSWRRMFLTRPQPRYNGCYISKTSYFRSGECNFHDQNYQPWHLVCYYRFIRFFPGGTALLFTSSESPQSVVSHLAHRDPKHAQVVCGRYWLEGSLVRLEFRRMSGGKRPPLGHGRTRGRRRGQGTTDVSETILDMCLELTSARRAGSRCWFLCWRSYTISSQLFSGQTRSTPVDVSQPDTFPQLAFSRVKSYSRDSTESL